MQTHYKIEAHAEWTHVMTNFVSRYKAKDGNDVTVEVGSSDTTVWHINRSLIPVDDLAALFGVEPVALADDIDIVLEPLEAWATDIRPTVDYIGHG